MVLVRFLYKTILISFLFGLICIGIIIMNAYLLGAPQIEQDQRTIIYDIQGEQLVPASQTIGSVTLTNISPYYLDATIAVEDSSFYEHHGFDYRGIIRALLKNVQSGRLKEGASTITQQYARNLYLTHEKTWHRKLKEAFYTIRLEMFYPKETILTGYVNAIYFGHGAYGIGQASHVYFNKHAKDLSLAEATMLAGIPKGPSYYSPFIDEERARNRQQYILQVLLDQGNITQAEYYQAKQEQLEFTKPYKLEQEIAPYFNDIVLQEAEQVLRKKRDDIVQSGYKIYTTLNKSLQKKTEEIVATRLENMHELQVGAIVLNHESGAIVSLTGGREYEESTFNRAVHAKRMVGSTFKPLLYYEALEHGFTPTTSLVSEPTTFALPDGTDYKPSNYEGNYAYKPISLAHAIALSDNIYAVKTNLFLQPERVAHIAEKFGIESPLPPVPSLALGSASLSLLELTGAYGVIASGGKKTKPYTIEKIETMEGRTVYAHGEHSERLFNKNKLFVLTHLMQGMFDRSLNDYMNVTGSDMIDSLTHEYAGKSGTTDTDSWMIGFSPKLTAGVWIGYDNNEPLRLPREKTSAKAIWAQIVSHAHKNDRELTFTIPDGVVKKNIDLDTGLLATEDCKNTRETYFEKGTEPVHYCSTHVREQTNEIVSTEKEAWFKQFFPFWR